VSAKSTHSFSQCKCVFLPINSAESRILYNKIILITPSLFHSAPLLEKRNPFKVVYGKQIQKKGTFALFVS